MGDGRWVPTSPSHKLLIICANCLLGIPFTTAFLKAQGNWSWGSIGSERQSCNVGMEWDPEESAAGTRSPRIEKCRPGGMVNKIGCSAGGFGGGFGTGCDLVLHTLHFDVAKPLFVGSAWEMGDWPIDE